MIKIYKTIQEAVKGNNNTLEGLHCYIKEDNVRIQTFRNCMKVTDLTNSLKRGKTCTQTVITYNNSDEVATDLQENYINPRKMCYQNLLNELSVLEINDLLEAGFDVNIRDIKGVNTFSPFADIKPIKLPKNGKWTISHVVKAIITGQIYDGMVKSRTSDDYARDSQANYHKNEKLNLMEFAEELITFPDGWRVNFEQDNNGNITLAVNCHHFNYNNLYFNVCAKNNNVEYTTVSKTIETTANTNYTTYTVGHIDDPKIINLFDYKHQKQIKHFRLISNLLESNNLDEFEATLKNYLESNKQEYIILSQSENTNLTAKLEEITNDNLNKIVHALDLLDYFKTSEDLKNLKNNKEVYKCKL